MATSFNEVYPIFLDQIDDKSLAKLADEDLKEMLDSYILNSAFVHFKQCRKDLSKYTPSTSDIIGEFHADLNREEKYILALGMGIEWITPKVRKESLFKQSLTNRDYAQSSNWQTLNKLMDLQASCESKLRKAILSYQYVGCGFDGI